MMDRVTPQPFDPGDDQDAMAEAVRQMICEIPLRMQRAAVYRDLGTMKQVECLIGGILVGLVGICFAHITAAGRDDLMEVIEAYLPQAREQAEAILDVATNPGEQP